MQRAPASWTFVLLVGGALVITGGIASLVFGIECFATSEPNTRCGVLTVAVPLVALPLGAGLAVVGAGLSGRLVRHPATDETPNTSSTDLSANGQDTGRTASR